MIQYKRPIFYILAFAALIAWLFRTNIRNAFPPTLKIVTDSLRIIDTDSTTSIAANKGNVIIVACFQTWCVDCARETPVLHELAQKIASPNFKVLYVSDEPVEKIKNFQQRFGASNILFTQSSKTMEQMGIAVFPTTYLIDKKGTVIKTKLEGYDWLQEESTIKKLLAE
jgi:thiol-disulfide isomerase/thioredoxin